MRILLIEDEKALSAAIVKMLSAQHFTVDTSFTGPDGLDNALSGIYDAIILDVMLPGMDGFSILEKLRAEQIATPVLMLTARGELEDRLRGLRSGADYYLTKPFQMEEMIACLRVITRRKSESPVMRLTCGDAELIEEQAKLSHLENGKSIKLGAKEFLLMEVFFRNPAQILPKERLNERVWGYDSEAEYNNLEVYVSFLRKKLQFIGSRLKIKAARGIGYMLEDEKP